MNTPTRPDRRTPPAPVAVGGRGDPGDEELLIDGQEEVFSRSEVELGRIEHAAGEDAEPLQGTARAGSARPDDDSRPRD